jgi:ATP-dependent Clp protease adapter protein ClpS
VGKRGGHRQGAGRKKGSITKRTQEITAAVLSDGITPLEYMLEVMRTSSDPKRKDAMAIAAASYVHPRLSSVEANVTAKVSHDDLVRELHDKARGVHERPN